MRRSARIAAAGAALVALVLPALALGQEAAPTITESPSSGFPDRAYLLGLAKTQALTAEQVDRIYRLTDSLLLNRDWVVVPLRGSSSGFETAMPDGKILVRPPAGSAFDSWFSGLKARLEALDLDRALRASQLERHYTRTPAGSAPGSGARRYVPPR